MTQTRPEFAAALLGSGARLNEAQLDLVDPKLARFTDEFEQVRLRSGELVGLKGLSGEDILRASIAAWASDAVPWPLSDESLMSLCDVVASPEGVSRTRSAAVAVPPSVAMLHSTSGSTASSKVAMRSVASVVVEAAGYRDGMAFGREDSVLAPLPMTHSLGFCSAISAILSGCGVIVESNRLPAAAARVLDHGRATKALLTPSFARLMAGARRCGEHVPAILLLGAGVVSDSLRAVLLGRFPGSKIVNGYGSTETGGTFIGSSGIGQAIPGVQVIWPPVGCTGELVIRTRQPVLGYFGEIPRTSNIWRTRDVVHRSENGADIQYLRRNDDHALRVNSRFVDVTQIKAKLAELPHVAEYILTVEANPILDDTEVLCLIVATPLKEATDLGQCISSVGDATQRPHVIFCSALPRNAIGKVDRQAVTELVRSRL